MKRQIRAALLLFACLGLKSACLPGSAATTNPPPAAVQHGPKIEFVSPHANDRIKDYPIFVETRVTGFTLASPVQYWDRVEPENKFLGHIHYTLDDSPIFATKSTHVVLGKPAGKALPVGTHVLRAELVNINHNSLTPPVYVEIPFVCDRGQQAATAPPIPIDENGRRQLEKVEKKLQETEKQFSELKSRLHDVP